MTEHASQQRWGRVITLAAVVFSALTLRGAVTSLAPLLDIISGDLGFGPDLIGVLGMLPPLCFAVAGFGTPTLMRWWGLRQTAVVSVALAGVGIWVRSLDGQPVLIIGSLIALLGMGMGNVVLPPLVKRYFPMRIPLISMIYISALQVGTLLPPLVVVPLAGEVGWRPALSIWALLPALALIPLITILIRDRGDHNTVTMPTAASDGGRVWRTATAWGLAFTFGISSLGTYTLFAWLPQILTDAGHTATYAGVMTSVFSAMGLPAAMVAPAIAARLRNPYIVVVLSAISIAAGIVGLALAPLSLAPLWMVLLGLGAMPFPMVLTLINLRTRTPAGAASLSGFTQGIGYITAIAGPLVFGYLHVPDGGYGASFVFLGASLLVSLIAGYFGCRPRYIEDTWLRRSNAAA